ncbi:hypothetical protein [Telluribacter sp.]|jgi:uncharacterized membrane protein SirB2|uniref:hypothetical protein n=1 Tax=Telluribacter sp. TaxID=1978767 RepID=UPI002E14E585|nr:hypothetical protein [Telluribacter sp.]
MDNTRFKRFFGALLTILGIIVILFACVAFLSDNEPVLGLFVTKWESIVPFLVGTVFLLSGISLVSNS